MGVVSKSQGSNAPKMNVHASENDVEFLTANRQAASKQSQLQVETWHCIHFAWYSCFWFA